MSQPAPSAANGFGSVPTLTDDLSVRLLDAVFGAGWGQRLFQEAPPDGSPGELLSTLFGAINAVIVAGVAFLMLYMLIVGVIASAHEGTPLGRRYHTLWVPIRSVLGIALLMPLPWGKGLSVVQALVMLLGWHSIAGASYLSGQVFDYLRDKGGGVAIFSFNAHDNARDLASTLFPSVVAAEFLAKVDHYPLAGENWEADGQWVASSAQEPERGPDAGKYGLDDPFANELNGATLARGQEDAWLSLRLGGEPTVYTLAVPAPESLGRGALGYVRIFCPTPGLAGGQDDGARFCRDQKSAVSALLRKLDDHAVELIDRHPYRNGAIAALKGDPIAAAVTAYREAMGDARGAFMVEFFARSKPAYLRQLTAYLRSEGWLALGAWYWSVSGFNEVALRVALMQPEAEGLKEQELRMAVLNDIDPYLDAARVVVASDHGLNVGETAELAQRPVSDLLAIGGNGGSLATSRFKGLQEGVAAMFVGERFAHGDVIANLQAQGNLLLQMVAAALKEAPPQGKIPAETLAKWLPTTRSTVMVGREIGMESGDAQGLSAIVQMLLVPIFLLGMFLAYYIPAVPFIIWALAFIGWMVVFVEAVVAAPLWAAAHALPEGEGFAGQQARSGYLLLMGVLLRPAMMVVGFFVAAVTVNSAAQLLLLLFRPFAEGMTRDYNLGIFTALGLAFVFGGLLIAVIHRVFGLISWLPDHVMNWFGGHGHAVGNEHEQVRQSVAGAAQQVAHLRAGMGRGGASVTSGRGLAEVAQSSQTKAQADDLALGEAPGIRSGEGAQDFSGSESEQEPASAAGGEKAGGASTGAEAHTSSPPRESHRSRSGAGAENPPTAFAASDADHLQEAPGGAPAAEPISAETGSVPRQSLADQPATTTAASEFAAGSSGGRLVAGASAVTARDGAVAANGSAQRETEGSRAGRAPAPSAATTSTPFAHDFGTRSAGTGAQVVQSGITGPSPKPADSAAASPNLQSGVNKEAKPEGGGGDARGGLPPPHPDDYG